MVAKMLVQAWLLAQVPLTRKALALFQLLVLPWLLVIQSVEVVLALEMPPIGPWLQTCSSASQSMTMLTGER